ncbi:hypothetical protein VTK56DRAFT_9950 [Thermocarpiscus australiensis]
MPWVLFLQQLKRGSSSHLKLSLGNHQLYSIGGSYRDPKISVIRPSVYTRPFCQAVNAPKTTTTTTTIYTTIIFRTQRKLRSLRLGQRRLS